MSDDMILKMSGISKSFPGVKALDNVNFEVRRGSVHGLIGENGAGKSTLMKILSGVYQQDEGEVYFNGVRVEEMDTVKANEIGISITYQEFNLVPTLSIAENIFINRLGVFSGNRKHTVAWKDLNKQATELLQRLGYELDVRMLVSELGAAQMQMVEIAKALSYQAKLIIMDEPTAPLTKNELVAFFRVINILKEQGVTIVFISHKLDEIFQLCDTVTVMRDGKMIYTKPAKETSKNEIIRNMIDREISQEFPERESRVSEVVMQVRDLNVRGKAENINFDLHKGEILGIIGLVGAGRSEMVKGVFGAEKHSRASITINGNRCRIDTPVKAIASGLFLLPEDRKQEGLFLQYDLSKNISAAKLKKIKTGMFINTRVEKAACDSLIQSLRIKTPSSSQRTLFLSGGNQQKVVIAKALFADPDILIMDEPTRGIDVGAKYEIYELMKNMVDAGKSIIFISSEFAEVYGMSDRVIVLHNKKKQAEFTRDQFSNTDHIMNYVLGQESMYESNLEEC